jgi:ankyrin repeat protein
MSAVGPNIRSHKSHLFQPLRFACEHGSALVVDALLKSEDWTMAELGFAGWRSHAVYAAVFAGRVSAVKLMLRHGFDVNEVNKAHGDPPLNCLAKCGPRRANCKTKLAVRLLRAKASVNGLDGLGQTSLQVALMTDNLAIVKVLVRAKADVNACGCYHRNLYPPLLVALDKHYKWYDSRTVGTCKRLLHAKADAAARLSNGTTALHLVAKHLAECLSKPHTFRPDEMFCLLEIVQELLLHRADAHSQTTAGVTPLQLAIESRQDLVRHREAHEREACMRHREVMTSIVELMQQQQQQCKTE